jgi:choline dehydrogenase
MASFLWWTVLLVRGMQSGKEMVEVGAQVADVVIVGAGSAGCVLAARLSEDPSVRVVLLEGGPDYPDVASLPGELVDGWRPAFTHDWGYASEPTDDFDSIPLPRARVVGGCSATNASFALRGAVEDYDRWATLGNPGWSFDDVLPAFCRLEHDLDFPDVGWHGADGPLPIRRYADEEIDPVQRAFLEAAVAVGDAPVEDHNRPGAVGVGKIPANSIDGERMSTARTYLAAARGRPNLEVRPQVLVDRVVVRDESAIGVRLAESAETVEAGLVILAAGAYGSPAILLRSGIGPAEDLRALGIPTVADLPGVGRNLQDHPLVVITFPVAETFVGPGYATVASWRSGLAAADEPYDMHVFCNGPFEVEPTDSGLASAPSPAVWGALVVGVMRPRSRGWLRLRSTGPEDPPRIYPAYLEHPDDLARLVEGVQRARSMLGAEPLAGCVIGPENPPWRGLDDQEALERVARAGVGPYYHPVGTCRMGPDPKYGAVVDAACRTHGVSRLVVADASVMPEIPAANTNIPTIMLAERVGERLTPPPGIG